MRWRLFLGSLALASSLGALETAEFKAGFEKARDRIYAMGPESTQSGTVARIDGIKVEDRAGAGANAVAAALNRTVEGYSFDLVQFCKYGGDTSEGLLFRLPTRLRRSAAGYSLEHQSVPLGGLPLEQVRPFMEELHWLEEIDGVQAKLEARNGGLWVSAEVQAGDARAVGSSLEKLLKSLIYLSCDARMAVWKAGRKADQGGIQVPLSKEGFHRIFPDWQGYEEGNAKLPNGYWTWSSGGRSYGVINEGHRIRFSVRTQAPPEKKTELEALISDFPPPKPLIPVVVVAAGGCYAESHLELSAGMDPKELKRAYEAWEAYSVKLHKKSKL